MYREDVEKIMANITDDSSLCIIREALEEYQVEEKEMVPGDPIKNMTWTKQDWENIMNELPNEGIMKYKIQCQIDTAIRNGEWK